MKKIITTFVALVVVSGVFAAKRFTMTITDNRLQSITGFGAASCYGAMEPYANDTQPVRLLFGDQSAIGLNIMRMEISPNFEGDVKVPEWNYWDTPYDWNGSLPSAKIVKQRGGIVFGTPWSPPGEYKTNGTAQGGNAEDQGNQRGTLRADCYEKFFPWLNTFLKWMHDKGVDVDAVSVQNEPDWWVSYSGCLYTPDEQLDLVKNYAHMLDRETYKGVRLISAEPLGFDPNYSNKLLNDPVARDQVDIIAGHIYGHPPLVNLKSAAKLAKQYGKEVWMTEHSVSDNIGERLPNWDEQLEFAREVNECLQAGCTGYIYWYMRAHWSFVSTGESKYGTENAKKNQLLPRAYVMSHFSKYVTGSTLLESSCTYDLVTNADLESSAFIKGDSLIVIAINSQTDDRDFIIKMETTPYEVISGERLLSWGNEKTELCQKETIEIAEPSQRLVVGLPGKSVATYVFKLSQSSTAVQNARLTDADGPATYYDLQGRRLAHPSGLCIEKSADGTSRKVFVRK
ncbi:MAG: endo-1,4-beta-xylanase xyn5A [Prevotella sp.]|nr:endo-1,4-beta-xylanase xyn5A [Prevotella sp.]